MHELGVVFHVIKQLNDLATEQELKRISKVTLQIGEVSGVVPDYLLDCWNWAVKKETVLKDAVLDIEPIKAVTYCEDCGANYETILHAKVCPKCNSTNTYLLTGNEFIIKDILAN